MKDLLITIILLATLIVNGSFQQNMNIKAKKIILEESNLINIEVKVEEGEKPYTYLLLDNVPWKNGKEIQKIENSYDTEITFKNMEKKDYMIFVKDTSGDVVFIHLKNEAKN